MVVLFGIWQFFSGIAEASVQLVGGSVVVLQLLMAFGTIPVKSTGLKGSASSRAPSQAKKDDTDLSSDDCAIVEHKLNPDALQAPMQQQDGAQPESVFQVNLPPDPDLQMVKTRHPGAHQLVGTSNLSSVMQAKLHGFLQTHTHSIQFALINAI